MTRAQLASSSRSLCFGHLRTANCSAGKVVARSPSCTIAAQHVGRDRIQFDGDARPKVFARRVARLGRPRRQVPLFDLFRRHRDALEDDLGIRRQFAQRLLDLLAGIDAGRIEVTEMIDVGRHVRVIDCFGGAVQEDSEA